MLCNETFIEIESFKPSSQSDFQNNFKNIHRSIIFLAFISITIPLSFQIFLNRVCVFNDYFKLVRLWLIAILQFVI